MIRDNIVSLHSRCQRSVLVKLRWRQPSAGGAAALSVHRPAFAEIAGFGYREDRRIGAKATDSTTGLTVSTKANQLHEHRPGAAEHLDHVLYVTTPKGWVALFTLLLMLGAAVAWSVMGEVATYVRADGLVLNRGGVVYDVAASSRGTLAGVAPSVGDKVAEGDIVAEIADPETVQRHVGAVALAEERLRTLRTREAEEKAQNELAERHIERQRARLDELQRTGSELIGATRERLASERALLERGLISREAVERSEQTLERVQLNLFDVLRRADEMEFDDLRRRNELRSRVLLAQEQLMAAETRVEELAAVIETWRIRAPVTGQVTEIRAQPGATLDAGQSVLAIETGGEGLDVLFYVAPADGKRIEAGMPARVSPVTFRREEFGLMLGTVQSLSEFPTSLDGLMAVLQNRGLAESFSRNGAPYPGRISLTPDPSTASGFVWTSPQAAEVDVTPGTLAEVEIEVERRPPVELIVPWIRERLGR